MVVSCIDFFENYTMKYIMTFKICIGITSKLAYWYALLTIEIQNDILDSNSLPFLKEVHYYVSNDTHHDSLFVQHAFMLHWEFLQTIRFSQANTWCGVMVAQGSSKV
jgi:hypothetical protein